MVFYNPQIYNKKIWYFIAISFNVISCKCHAEELFTFLYKYKQEDRYFCSQSLPLATTKEKLCNANNFNIDPTRKYSRLIKHSRIKNVFGEDEYHCSTNPLLASTREQICQSHTIDFKDKINEIQGKASLKLVFDSVQRKKERFLGININNDYKSSTDDQENHNNQVCNPSQIITISSGSAHDDQMLKEYAAHIANIKPYSRRKVLEYINFVNRNIYPNNIDLVLHNCGDKDHSKQYMTLAFGTKESAINFEVNSNELGLGYQDYAAEFLKMNRFSLNHKNLNLEGKALYNGLSEDINNQYNIKYNKVWVISPTEFVNTNVSYNNFDYLSDIYISDIYNTLLSNNFVINDVNFISSNFVLGVDYTALKNQNVEYTIGFTSSYTKYHPKFGITRDYDYNINNIYAITRLHELGVSFYLDNEFIASKKYRNTAAAVFYEKKFKNYFLNILFMYNDRRANLNDKIKYFNYDFKIGKHIYISHNILKRIKPHISIGCVDILNDLSNSNIHLNQKNNVKIGYDIRNKFKKEVGISVLLTNKNNNMYALNVSGFHIDKNLKGVSLSMNVRL